MSSCFENFTRRGCDVKEKETRLLKFKNPKFRKTAKNQSLDMDSYRSTQCGVNSLDGF